MVKRVPPPELVEWQQACNAYIEACEAGVVIEAHRIRIRTAWTLVKDQIASSPDILELMNEVTKPLQ
jgi:hypothetical protein